MFLSFHFKITKDCWVIEDEVKNLKFVKPTEPACNRIIVIFEKLNFNFKKSVKEIPMRLKVKSCVGSISPLLALIKFLKSLNFKRNDFTFSKEFIRKPFARPPPSSFEAPPACTVSLSAPYC